jgi:undecaprenyl-diphosphatase
MLEQLVHIDQEIFLFLNGLHNSFFDFIMYWVSQTVIWIPLWLYFIYMIVKKFEKKSWIIILALFIAVGLSDFLSVHLFKNVFERLRPCHNPQISSMVHIVKDHCGGKYGFVSSHSANMFSIATFMFLLFKNEFPKSIYLVFVWAGIIAYSRVYLGVHYPGDILGGAILGSAVSVIYWWLIKKFSFAI